MEFDGLHRRNFSPFSTKYVLLCCFGSVKKKQIQNVEIWPIWGTIIISDSSRFQEISILARQIGFPIVLLYMWRIRPRFNQKILATRWQDLFDDNFFSFTSFWWMLAISFVTSVCTFRTIVYFADSFGCPPTTQKAQYLPSSPSHLGLRACVLWERDGRYEHEFSNEHSTAF